MVCIRLRLSSLVSVVAIASLMGAGRAVGAEAAFAIEAQDLAGALKAFAFQSQREIFFAPELARGKRTEGVRGKLKDLAALDEILKGTGLGYTPAQPGGLHRDRAGISVRAIERGAPFR